MQNKTNIMHNVGKISEKYGGQFDYLFEMTLAFSKGAWYTVSNIRKQYHNGGHYHV